MGGSGKSEAETDGMGREGAEGSSQLAGKTLEPEAATQASKQAGGEEMGRRGSEGRSVRVVDNPEVGHTAIHEKVDCREKQEKSMKSGKSAGLTLPARAAKCLESAEIQMKFIGLYTNGMSTLPCSCWVYAHSTDQDRNCPMHLAGRAGRCLICVPGLTSRVSRRDQPRWTDQPGRSREPPHGRYYYACEP